MKIVKLVAENFKRLKAVEIQPDGGLVIIRGENGAGKSSVIDSIWAALGGKNACPDKPIRDGEDKATISLDLGDYVVTRTFTLKDTYLAVRTRDGATLPNPQKMLDGIIGAVGFDPFEFSRKPAKEQAKTLASVAGLDFAALNAERKAAYEARTEANREVKRYEALVDTKAAELEGIDESKFTALTSIDEVLAEQKAAQEAHEQHRALVAKQRNNADYIHRKRAEIETLQNQLRQAESELESASVEANHLGDEVDTSEQMLPDMGAIDEKLRTVNDHNENVRAIAELRSLEGQLKEAQSQALEHDFAIRKIDGQKQVQIEKAQLPVDGLLFDEAGIYLNGIPFDQCCASEQLKVSVALAMRLNPTLRVIRILDGSLLDHKSMTVIQELAQGEDFQVWVEVVDESTDGPGVLIEDGAVRQ